MRIYAADLCPLGQCPRLEIPAAAAGDPPSPPGGDSTAAAAGPILHELGGCPMTDKPLSPAGYLAGLHRVLGMTTTTDRPKDPEDYNPEDDEPWTVIDRIPLGWVIRLYRRTGA